ncbi:hypothetical protein [Gemmatimonas sp.]|uniref:hypothetical protein n=1 Tax=Gemmatimonas sp. TaxID=1962908 RepID=UPI002ED8D801
MQASPLLSLLNATAVWHSGLPPACLASVRFLDAVSLTVSRGDCIIIRHRDPAAAGVLLSVLAGHPATLSPAHWNGQRNASTGLRIRRAAIRVGAMPWILEGWQSIAPASASVSPPRAVAEPSLTRTPMVHLLRASRDATLSAFEGRQWQRWARSQAMQGNAVVLVAQALPATPPPRLGQSAAPSVRELQFRHGRLLP